MKRLLKNSELGNSVISSSKKHISGNHPVHFHEFYEIEYVIQGTEICTINGKEFICSNGTLFFMTPVDCHSVQTEGADIFNVMFSEELVEFQQLEPFLRYEAPKAFVIDDKNRSFFEQLFAEIIENKKNTKYISALMGCFLLKLAQLLPDNKVANLSNVVSKMHFYILNHFQKKITLEMMASHVGLTPSYASALFKKEMKIGFKSYLNSLRLEYARKLLADTEQTISQICEESGFDDIPNFLKRFKAYYGMTPTQLRENHKEALKVENESGKSNSCVLY